MQPTDFAAHDEPATETAPAQMEAPRVKAPPPPQFGLHCCYPFGEPRTPGFRYCTAPVAQQGAPYCLDHMRLCHIGWDIAA
jgi:GcrA cell cycle regulator